MSDLSQRYQRVQQQIAQFCDRYQRPPAAVELIAVSKQHSVDKIIALQRLGQTQFAENYVQEAAAKMAELAAHQQSVPQPVAAPPLQWHFIGQIQSRKCQQIATLFDWVHSVASVKVARRLNQFRAGRPRLNVLIQLNLENEASKAGIHPSDLTTLSQCLQDCPQLRFAGLMLIPQPTTDFAHQRAVFARAKALFDHLKQQGYAIDQLSMGMSQDLEAAIAAGATQVRIGTALFGPRT